MCNYDALPIARRPDRVLEYPEAAKTGELVVSKGLLLIPDDMAAFSAGCRSPFRMSPTVELPNGLYGWLLGSRLAVPENPDHLFYWLELTCEQVAELIPCSQAGAYVEVHGTYYAADSRISRVTHVRQLPHPPMRAARPGHDAASTEDAGP